MSLNKTQLKILRQGGPIINYAYIEAKGPRVVAIYVDLSSKYCRVEAFTEIKDAPVLFIGGENAIHLKKGKEKFPTSICFPEFKGWEVFSYNIGRYALNLCLVKSLKS